MNILLLLSKPARGSAAYIRRGYYLYDRFDTARAAGAVNGTQAEPIGGARTVVDTNGKIAIANGALTSAAGAAANDNINYPSVARLSGIFLLVSVTPADTSGTVAIGFEAVPQSGAIRNCIQFTTTTGIQAGFNAVLRTVGVYTATNYQVALGMRTGGNFMFVKGGAFTNWTMLYIHAFDSSAALPEIWIGNAFTSAAGDNVRVSKRRFIPAPLQSDAMSAATTDGQGNQETNGPVGTAYTDVGTWGVTGGKRSCSALSGGLGFSYLACSSSNVIIEAVCTRSAGVTGLVARYADASNYLIAYHDGTNAKLDKVVAGVTTNLLTAVVAYSASAPLSLHLDGTSVRLFYNNTVVGTVATTPAAGSLNHGLYTTDTGATFDNLVIWAKGNEGQYEALSLL